MQPAVSLASLAEFALPAVLTAVAFGALVRRLHRARLVRGITISRGLGLIENMTWVDFELVVGEAFRRQGYDVHERGPARGDGVAFELKRAGEIFLVECKHWQASVVVGVPIVREFYGVLARSGAAGGFLITSSRFSDDALAYAQDSHLELIDGKALVQLLAAAA